MRRHAGRGRPVWRELGAAAGDLLLGAACAGCGSPGWGICLDCQSALDAHPVRDGRPEPCPPRFPRTYSAGPYDDIVAALITAHKEQQALTLAPVLGRRLASAVTGLITAQAVAGDRPVVLVPVPSSRGVVRDRGLDAAAAIARDAARELRRDRGRTVAVGCWLAQSRVLADQAALDATARWANLHGGLRVTRAAVRATRRAQDRPAVIVVDDVVTTGASLTEAARALDGAGWAVVGAATVAATVRRGRVGTARP